MSNKFVLMVLYYFPPCGSSGVLRSVRFVRGLKAAGRPPAILTVAERDIGTLAYGTVSYDESHRDVEGALEVLRARAIRPSYVVIAVAKWFARGARNMAGALRREVPFQARESKWRPRGDSRPHEEKVKSYYSAETGPFMKFVFDLVLIVDTLFEWAPRALALALRHLDRSSISHIYSSSPPLSAHYVALWLKMLWRKKWIMDLRDPLFDFDDSISAGSGSIGPIRAYYRLVESILIRNADVVICNCEEIRAHYESRYPRARFEVITNSYDADAGVGAAEKARRRPSVDRRYTIGHFGLMYPTVRTPDSFLRGLSSAIRKRAGLEKIVRVDFVGDRSYTGSAAFWSAIRKLDLEAVVRVEGYVPHEEILPRMAASALLLILQPHGSTRHQIPAKLFEYLAARRPILAVAPEGSATHGIVRRYGLGFVRDPSDIEGMAQDILAAIDGVAPIAGEDAMRAFSSETTTGLLMKIVDSLS